MTSPCFAFLCCRSSSNLYDLYSHLSIFNYVTYDDQFSIWCHIWQCLLIFSKLLNYFSQWLQQYLRQVAVDSFLCITEFIWHRVWKLITHGSSAHHSRLCLLSLCLLRFPWPWTLFHTSHRYLSRPPNRISCDFPVRRPVNNVFPHTLQRWFKCIIYRLLDLMLDPLGVDINADYLHREYTINWIVDKSTIQFYTLKNL